jgi:hypothetical protein
LLRANRLISVTNDVFDFRASAENTNEAPKGELKNVWEEATFGRNVSKTTPDIDSYLLTYSRS